MGKTKISSRLKDNEAYIRERCKNCADILIRPMRIGTMGKTDCLMVYIEVAVSNMMLDDSAIGKMINHFWESSPEQIQEFMRNNSLGIADVKKFEYMEDAFAALLAGNAAHRIKQFLPELKLFIQRYIRIPHTVQDKLVNLIQYLSVSHFSGHIQFFHQKISDRLKSLPVHMFSFLISSFTYSPS